MGILKQTRDYAIRLLNGRESVPRGLFESQQYFRQYDPIFFRTERQGDGSIIATSENFRYGSIITHSQTEEDLNEKIKDAILTAFEVPSSYAKEANIQQVDRVGNENKQYAFS
ncbi:MAG: hypothetical protein AAB400_00040 [Patescibacteria group bacterium]